MQSIDVRQIRDKYPDYIHKVEGNYWWNFAVVLLDSMIYAFSVAMLSQDTIMPYYVSRLTDNNIIIGLVPALYFLGFFFPQLIGAYIVNGKKQMKWAIFWIAVAERTGIFFIALITQYLGIFTQGTAVALLLISYTLFSITNGLIAPGYAHFISKNIFKNRGLFFAMMTGLGGLIGFGASMLARHLLNTFMFPINLRYLFWIGFATSFISPLFIALYREVPFPDPPRQEPLIDFFRSIPKFVSRTPDFRRYMLVRAFQNLGLLANAFYALYAMSRFNLDDGSLGIFTMIILLTQSLLGFIWGWFGDRFGYKAIYVIGSFFLITMGAFSLFSPGNWGFHLIAFCIGGFYSMIRTADPNMVFELAPPAETSRFIGISNTFVAPVLTFAPLIGGGLVRSFSHQALFTCVLIIGLISVFLTIGFMPNPRKE